jgi:hypothetical protein
MVQIAKKLRNACLFLGGQSKDFVKNLLSPNIKIYTPGLLSNSYMIYMPSGFRRSSEKLRSPPHPTPTRGAATQRGSWPPHS